MPTTAHLHAHRRRRFSHRGAFNASISLIKGHDGMHLRLLGSAHNAETPRVGRLGDVGIG